jgi:hypothetical protein
MGGYTKEKQKQYMAERYKQQRQALILLLGGKCCKCGSGDGLIFDHKDPSQKSFSISRYWGKKKFQIVMEELMKCQLLCGTCNDTKTRQDLSVIAKAKAIEKHGPDGFRHGTQYGWMVKHCQCQVCYQEKRRWHNTRNALRRKEDSCGPYKQRF